jgi:hypothetical protein
MALYVPSNAGLKRLGISLVSLECIEGFVSVSNEWKTHFCFLLFGHSACKGSVRRRCVFLWDFINWEIGDINIGGETRLKGSTDSAKLFPDHATEERVVLDLGSTAVSAALLTNTVFCIAKEARSVIG